MHSRKSLLFNKIAACVKKGDDNLSDVTMSYDGAEVCEPVALYILHNLGNTYNKENIGLYRGDGLAAFNKINGSQAERHDPIRPGGGGGGSEARMTKLTAANQKPLSL